MRRALPVTVVMGLSLAACTPGGTPEQPRSATGDATPASARPSPSESPVPDAQFQRKLRRILTVPPLPAFTIPTNLLSTPENQRISGELDLHPGLFQGIAVLDARCTDAGAAAADAGATTAGGAHHFEDGAVSITVAGDGTGVYDTHGLHVAVLADGAGVYEDGTVRVSTTGDGSGTYSSDDLRLTVRADGSGSYSDDSTRVWVDADGAGGYEDATMRLSWNSSGEVFGDGDPERVGAVRAVLADGLPPFPPVPRVELVQPTGTVCGAVIRLDANVLFDVDRAAVDPGGQEHLRRVADLLQALGEPRAQINGHTDSVGDDAYNVDLSERRADAVRDHLVGLGVSEASLATRGLGETQLLRAETGADGAVDPAARQANRRVEIVLLDG